MKHVSAICVLHELCLSMAFLFFAAAALVIAVVVWGGLNSDKSL